MIPFNTYCPQTANDYAGADTDSAQQADQEQRVLDAQALTAEEILRDNRILAMSSANYECQSPGADRPKANYNSAPKVPPLKFNLMRNANTSPLRINLGDVPDSTRSSNRQPVQYKLKQPGLVPRLVTNKSLDKIFQKQYDYRTEAKAANSSSLAKKTAITYGLGPRSSSVQAVGVGRYANTTNSGSLNKLSNFADNIKQIVSRKAAVKGKLRTRDHLRSDKAISIA